MRVMIIGASKHRHKFGNKAVRAYLRQGHQVFPVNPHEDAVEGLKVYNRVDGPPGPIDRVLFYVPPVIGLEVMAALGQREDIGEIWLNPGAESDKLVALARSIGHEPVLACAIVDIGEMP